MALRVALRFTRILAISLFASTAARAEVVFPRSSGVGLEPPAGMIPSDAFLGFHEGPASIVIVELPKAAFAQIVASKDRLAAKVQDAKSADFAVGALSGFIIRGRQSAGTRTYRKWVVVLDAPERTVMVTAQVPTDDTAVSDAAIETALKTIAVRQRPGLAEQIAALPYTIGDEAGFRPVLSALGVSLVLTQGPKDVDPDHTQPDVVVATSLNHPPADMDRATYAKLVLASVKALTVDSVISDRAFDVDGVHWAEVEAKGHQSKAATPVDISFFVRFGDQGFIMVAGSAPTADPPAFAERFRRLALSVKPKS